MAQDYSHKTIADINLKYDPVSNNMVTSLWK